jgi:hypothetical protein
MALFAAAARRNLSLFEISVSLIVIAVLARVFFDRVRSIEAAKPESDLSRFNRPGRGIGG